MSFPSLTPSRRSVSLGDTPVRAYRAMSGAETRILYGNQRSEATLELFYEKLSASEADQFVTHYDSVKGTAMTFAVGTPLTVGWVSGSKVQGPGQWRYDGPPSFEQNGGECDRVNVSVKLKTVVG